ncbi:MAG: RNA polymerase sigma factor [Longimicrobiales bacterium]
MAEGSSNAALVERVRSGSPEAIAELYALHGPRLYRIARRLMPTAEDAEDILQDVFVGLPEAIREYEHRDTLEGWLRTLTVRASLMAARTQQRRREVSFSDVAMTAPAEAPATVDRITLEKTLGRLPDTMRQVFVLKVVEGYSHNEIGEFLGITSDASRMQLHRAREVLERRLRSSA